MSMHPKVKRLLHIVSWVLAVFWIGIAGISMAYVIAAGRSPTGPELFGYRFMAVLSDSMTPNIASGDLVVGRPPSPEKIQVGQIVTYKTVMGQRLVTHRVVEVTHIGNEIAFVTKGDANALPDEGAVLGRDVLATYTLHIPFAGYLLTFARTLAGLVVLVIIPSLTLMGIEAKNLIRLLKYEEGRAQPE